MNAEKTHSTIENYKSQRRILSSEILITAYFALKFRKHWPEFSNFSKTCSEIDQFSGNSQYLQLIQILRLDLDAVLGVSKIRILIEKSKNYLVSRYIYISSLDTIQVGHGNSNAWRPASQIRSAKGCGMTREDTETITSFYNTYEILKNLIE